MRLRFLGTGTSFGVPVVGCDCPVCVSDEARNRRSRHAMTLERGERILLIDTPPELRLQLLREGIRHVDAVFLTHLHADHVHGIDDLRIFSIRGQGSLPMYIAREHASELRSRFRYIFDESVQPIPGTSAPEIELHEFDEESGSLAIAGFNVTPLCFPHGNTQSYGFRVGRLGVVVDAKRVPDRARRALQGVEVLVINALWLGKSHPSHLSVEEAVEVAGDLGARRTYLTHLTHRLEYNELREQLPPGVQPAHDGLVVEIEEA